MENFIAYLERMIEGCDSLCGMEREKATYQSVLKEYRKQCNIAVVVGQSEQLSLCQCDKPSPDIMYGETCTECCLEIDPKA